MEEALLTRAKSLHFAWFNDPSDVDMRRYISRWNPLKSSNQALQLMAEHELALMTQEGVTGACYSDRDDAIVYIDGTDPGSLRKAIVTAYVTKYETAQPAQQ